MINKKYKKVIYEFFFMERKENLNEDDLVKVKKTQ